MNSVGGVIGTKHHQSPLTSHGRASGLAVPATFRAARDFQKKSGSGTRCAHLQPVALSLRIIADGGPSRFSRFRLCVRQSWAARKVP